MIIPVVLAGGVGSRLWPLSREKYPKQCLKLGNQNLTMLQTTFERAKLFASDQFGVVVTHHDHRFLVAQQLADIGLKTTQIILEPEGKNTAPAIALAAFKIIEHEPQAMMLVLPSDHIINDIAAFKTSMNNAIVSANNGNLVAFGIKPTYPETGYGYIKAQSLDKAVAVEQFIEKPDLERAEQYLADGNYFWNSGMFLFKAQAYLDELKALQPAIFNACFESNAKAKSDMDFYRVDAVAFAKSPSNSIDYAVMEKTEKAEMVPYLGDWSDIASWSALYDFELTQGDQAPLDGNLVHGDVLVHDSKNNFVRAESALVSLVGVEDLVVVQTEDAILVANRKRSQEVKYIVSQLQKDTARTEHVEHKLVHRPWGTYQRVDQGHRFQVKRIIVKPKEKLSVQMHHHRAEHWIVVKGTARVTNGDKEYLVTENESTFIPVGQVHALENPGKVPLHIIEVQSGSYLGEDDIIRLTERSDML